MNVRRDKRGWSRAGIATAGLALTAAAVAFSAPASRPGADRAEATPARADALRGTETVVFSGGCFWGVQAVFEHVKGVVRATSGYAGGDASTAEYERVSEGDTGHAESVEVVFDPTVVSFHQLLDVFFTVAHDPTELNRQGPDVGTQYRSVVWTTSPAQAGEVRAYIAALDSARTYRSRVVTRVEPLKGFYRAEAYHQDYALHHPDNPYIAYNDLPKIEHLKQRFPALWRDMTVTP